MYESGEPVQARFYVLSGHVQGIGFRPFVYRLAHECGIRGWIQNRMGEVVIHAEGRADYLQAFQYKLIHQAPPHSKPVINQCRVINCNNYPSFAIIESSRNARNDVRILADLPVCDDCLKELFDPNNRRYRYPFINCTQCGPRYTLIRCLPYDRVNTTMAGFALCSQCRQEYHNPDDRRYHAEPVACSNCGPTLCYQQGQEVVEGNDQALHACIAALREGRIVAVKGVGGYHLIADACNDAALAQLRRRKSRPHKPLAVMISDRQLADYVQVGEAQRELLNATAHPILLLPAAPNSELSGLIAPQLQEIGVMTPYSPLHHLLVEDFGGPLVATSANISGEPVLTGNDDVSRRLAKVAHGFLHHNRPIQRPADDPVYRVINRKPRPLRLGRGNAPVEMTLPVELPEPLLAVGGHMKNTIALAWGERLVVSPHIGELESPRSQQVFHQVIEDLQKLYHVRPRRIVCDAHPRYYSSQWARQTGKPVVEIFHHHAHASVLSGEFIDTRQWLVFAWDGTGFGEDGTLWGGEALLGNPGNWRRVASMRPFYLPGGDKASLEPWRSAAALCWQTGNTWRPAIEDIDIAWHAWQRKLRCPQTSAVGRMFDAAAALLGLATYTSFEGQGPMWLEARAETGDAQALSLAMDKDDNGVWRIDWQWLIEMLMDSSMSVPDRARCFHETMALSLLHQALQIREEHGDFAVGLTGGVFQNRLLAERAMDLLQQHGFLCYMPEKLPVNDGGLCYGQLVEACALLTKQTRHQPADDSSSTNKQNNQPEHEAVP
ncbi:MAG: carbamoyltransferase HypF [Gammaproteobacteria bacterium]|jgi:hydrogenase maturation protein HypF